MQIPKKYKVKNKFISTSKSLLYHSWRLSHKQRFLKKGKKGKKGLDTLPSIMTTTIRGAVTSLSFSRIFSPHLFCPLSLSRPLYTQAKRT